MKPAILGLLAVVAASVLTAAPARAHTEAFGWIEEPDGSVTVYVGTYEHGSGGSSTGGTLGGSITLSGPVVASAPFTTITGSLPAGLVLGVNYFESSYFQPNVWWMGANTTGLTPGNYTASLSGVATPHWSTYFDSQLGPHFIDPIVPVVIDIKPGSDPNTINVSGTGLISVAILGSDIFDVADVDPDSLAFGPNGAPIAHGATMDLGSEPKGPHYEDVDLDGDTDLVSHYYTDETGILLGDTEACLTAELVDATPIEACDDIRTVAGRKCGLGFESALLLAPLMLLRRRRRA